MASLASVCWICGKELNEAIAAQGTLIDNDFSGHKNEINGRAPHGDAKP